MRTPQTPAPSIVELIEPFRKLLTPGRWKYLVAMIMVIATSPQARTISEAWRCAPFEAHYEQFRRLLWQGPFDDDRWLGEQLALLQAHDSLITTLPDGERFVVAAVDDSINKRPFASKLFALATHFDHAPRPGQRAHVKGHKEVLFGLIPDALGVGRAKACVTASSTFISMKHKEQSGEQALEYESRLELGADLVARHRRLLNEDASLLTLTDAFYGKTHFMGRLSRMQRVEFLSRLQTNRALFELPEVCEADTPQGGRPALYGQRIDWRERLAQDGREVQLKLYGRQRRVRLWSSVVRLRGLLQPVQVIAAHLLDHARAKPTLFVTSLTTLAPEMALRLYAARFSLEESIKDLRTLLGWGSEQVRASKPRARMQRFFFLTHTLMRLLADHQPRFVRERLRDPWRDESLPTTLGEIQQALRAEVWRGVQVLATCGLRPQRDETPHAPHEPLGDASQRPTASTSAPSSYLHAA